MTPTQPNRLSILLRPLEWLTRPPATITHADRRLQMRLLLGINAVFLHMMIVMGGYFAFFDNLSPAFFWTIVGPFIGFGGMSAAALALGRSRRYQAAAYLTILMMILFAYVAIFITTPAHAVFYVLITLAGVCVAGLFLSFRATVAVALVNTLALIVLIPPLRVPVTSWVAGPEFIRYVEPFTPTTFIIAMSIQVSLSVALVIFMWMWTALENERAKEREKAAEQTRLADEMRAVVNIRSQFLSNVSHELRTPLNAILGYSHSMQNMPKLYDGQSLPEIFRNDIRLIEASGEDLLGLINDLLDLSKLDAGKFEIDPHAANLHDVCKGAIATAVGLVREKPVEVRLDLPGDLPLAWADARRVR
jgi:signal transduction histidine kinase